MRAELPGMHHRVHFSRLHLLFKNWSSDNFHKSSLQFNFVCFFISSVVSADSVTRSHYIICLCFCFFPDVITTNIIAILSNSHPPGCLTNATMQSFKEQPEGSPLTRKQAVTEPSTSRIVPKPISQLEATDPRAFHVSQLSKRFQAKEYTAPDGATSLHCKLVPSDPDFPFELTALECDVRVPQGYPAEKPSLVVMNKDIPRGFGINIERGWDGLVEEKQGASLLALMNALDKNLERFLTEQKVQTIKMVNFKDSRKFGEVVGKDAITANTPKPVDEKAKGKEPVKVARPYVPEPSYTKDQIAEAKTRRAQEIRQLESRMGRVPEYKRSADGIVYTLSIEPKRKNELPSGLHSVRTIHLIVPHLYPLQDLRVQLNEAEAADAEPVEDLFVERAAEQKSMSLMSLVNYLSVNLHKLAKEAAKRKEKEAAEAARVAEEMAEAERKAKAEDPDWVQIDLPGRQVEGKGHMRLMPPEWSLVQGPDDEDDDESYDDSDEYELDGGASLETEPAPPELAPMAMDTPERGTMLTFPSLELYKVEILTISLLSITVKCERCRTFNDFSSLKPGIEQSSHCKKCADPLVATFRPQLLHQHSTRAGFIDVGGCKVQELLPSTFVPTCETCSTSAPGLLSVRGDATTNICRECHTKFTFKLPDVKFLVVTPGQVLPPSTGPRRKTEKLGLHAGTPLPNNGACQHYRRSYRWFRFSCCERVYPCDKCHDAAEKDHENEWAARMVCGWCSREGRYKPESCGFCGRSVIGRKGRGFWEGGKGTRDQRMMSRKDPRKYKRIGTSQKKDT